MLLLTFLCGGALQSHAKISFALDSIAQWGKFPRFCVGVYRWGDHFFNGYDTTYVEGSGYKFNIKAKADSWIDNYDFRLSNDTRIQMHSDPSTSAGLWLTYLAVSVGYDVNVSQLLTGNHNSRKRFQFGFNCALFSANLYWINNEVGTRIYHFGPPGENLARGGIDFNGIYSSNKGVNATYYFNHKHYSQAAALGGGRIQRKSSGTFVLGFSYSNQDYSFDFSSLPQNMQDLLPADWPAPEYFAQNTNYNFILGYNHNWVIGKHWTLSLQLNPSLGWRDGFSSNEGSYRASFSLANSFKTSAVWNNKRWFGLFVGSVDTNLIYRRKYTFASSYLTGAVSFGYRFNIW